MERNTVKPAIIGFVIGASIPCGYGIYGMVHEIAYRASLRTSPDLAFCGMGLLGAWMMILCVGPVCGLVGAAAGLAVSAINRKHHEDRPT